ncbi:5'-deoxynucleotidase HDDC2-like [Hydractinia symbiolongicarpus]|uniref:5'-deoxynucleotidase HDDC2-like n=1 Tax=Hydractinia symbiolongicarpus TaxID=13093 RepID=UPI00254D66F5|nr:5'-deoxynucleotidase HDDC2-like [Hydractinia symbiolongicarpus]
MATATSTHESKENFPATLEFFTLVGQIKRAQRTGWTHHNVDKVESVSDHIYRMAVMTMLLEGKNLNTTHCMKMAVIHDLAECIVGDITPFCGVSAEEKYRREKEAMFKLTSLISNEKVGNEVMSLWEEYTNQNTKEARAVKDIDRFEMILQAFEYEKSENKPGNLQTFFNSTKGKFGDPQIQRWVEELDKQRQVFTETHKPEAIIETNVKQ